MERGRVSGGEGDAAPQAAGSMNGDLGMVGDSAAMERLRQRIRQVAPTDETVLICGESGTGKELVARAIHAASRRAQRAAGEPQLPCPVAAVDRERTVRPPPRRVHGRRRATARAGSSWPTAARCCSTKSRRSTCRCRPSCCACCKSARSSQWARARRGSADVRVIASTNRDLPAEIAAGRFREDLYYRLAVVPLELPPLRERARRRARCWPTTS